VLEAGPFGLHSLALGASPHVAWLNPASLDYSAAFEEAQMRPIDPKTKERYAELVGLGCRQHEAAQGVGVQAPR
jgi:hypothetical protein